MRTSKISLTGRASWQAILVAGARGPARRFAGLRRLCLGFYGVGHQDFLFRVHLHVKQRPRKPQIGLQLQRCIAQLQSIPVAQQEVAVLEHPQVARPVVNRPQRFGLDRSRRQRQHHGANLALVAGIALARFTANQPRHAKGEEQPVLIQKVQRGKAVRACPDTSAPGAEKPSACDGQW